MTTQHKLLKLNKYIVFLFFFSFTVQMAFAQNQPLPSSVVQALQRAGINQNQASWVVQAVDSDKPLLNINSQSAMNPASLMKLVTTYAALDLLGPTFTWKTQVLATGTINDGVLNGELIIKGSGDPKLVLENFWLMLRQIRARGVREIKGNLVLDKTAFSQALPDPNQFDGEAARAYNVAPDALLVNYKAMVWRFLPDPNQKRAIVSADILPANLKIENNLKLVEGVCGDWRGKLLADFSQGKTARFSGSYAASCGEKVWPMSLMSPTAYVEGVFKTLWQELGGKFDGRVVDAASPAQAKLLYEHSSPALVDALRDMNKYSNNVMARQVFLTLSAENGNQTATPEASAQVVKQWLNEKTLPMPELVLENGSGLSRIERIAPINLSKLLLSAYASPYMADFMSGLPIAGLDGTMRRRLNKQDIAGRAYIKTGTLNDVRGVAGYVLAASGKRYAVVSILNGAQAAAGQAAQDAFLLWVFQNG